MRPVHPEDLQPDVRGRARPEHEVHGAVQADDPVPGRQDLRRHRRTSRCSRPAPSTTTRPRLSPRPTSPIAKTTPKLSQASRRDINPQDFRVYYVFFKTKATPFNNLKVRQAFAHAVDRNTIISALLPGLAIPAYGYLMDGYPFAVSQPLEKYTNYDPELAQKLLAEAGYPKGKGFPTVTFSYPADTGALDSTNCRARRAGTVGRTGTGLVRRQQHAAAVGAGHVDLLYQDGGPAERRSRWGSCPTGWTTSTPPTC